MFKRTRATLLAALAVCALSVPAAATASPGQPSAAASQQQQQQLSQIQSNVRALFASEGGWHLTSTAAPASAPSAGPGFDWGDAGIGAAGALGLLGLAAVPLAISRRRQGGLAH